jgi:hypothetical protein
MAFPLRAIAPNAKTARIQNLSCKLRANPKIGSGTKDAHTVPTLAKKARGVPPLTLAAIAEQ